MAATTTLRLAEHFGFPKPRKIQVPMMAFIEQHDGRAILEAGTGEGKSDVGMAFLRSLAASGERPLFYIVPTKSLVDQLQRQFPDVGVAYGRHEHECLYPTYAGGHFRADEIPCLSLQDCPYRVDQETGETHDPTARQRCPYYRQTYEARQSDIIICTFSFFLFTQLSGAWPKAAGLVIDEAHDLAEYIRSALSYDITDYHLERGHDLLAPIDAESAQLVDRFRRDMVARLRRKPEKQEVMLEDSEIERLIGDLKTINRRDVQRTLRAAIRNGVIDPVTDRETLTKLERITNDLVRYVRALEYSLPTRDRSPLNYTYGYYTREPEEGQRAQYRLVIRSYYVAPLIQRLTPRRTVAYSATIGDPQIFGKFVTGIEAPFLTLPSSFPAEHSRIFVPTDTPNLAYQKQRRQDVTRTLRKIARACRRFADAGHRSLVLVVSNAERQKFLLLAEEENIAVVSYNGHEHPRLAVARFKAGVGDVLAGTVANYGQGIDLRDQVAPVIFVFRPAYARPDDPQAIFEDRRFGRGNVWRIRKWQVMNDVLQARGRNIRSRRDFGVTFLISQQFRNFAYHALPEWLQSAYRGEQTFEEGVAEALTLLKTVPRAVGVS